jgi:HEAT repeat protein
MVGSIALMAIRRGEPAAPEPVGDEAPLYGGRGGPAVPGKSPRSPKTDETEDGPDEDPGGIIEFGPVRGAEGEVFTVTPDKLRIVFAARHWEEIRRMIDVLQADGETVPEDVVKALIEMLSKDDLRLDAVLALGGVKDAATGRALAELALSGEATPETRQAALDAIAKGGQTSALPLVQQLLAVEGLDDGVARHALFALAGIGGPDAAKTLLDMLERHSGDDLRGAVVAALGKARDADSGLASLLRAARDKGDRETLQAVLVAAQIRGAAVGEDLKVELQRLVESDAALSAFPDEVERQIVQGTAMPAAVAAGVIEPVLRVATTSGPMRDIALNALREARGDTAAKLIAAALLRATDEIQRRELTVALGETGSSAATATLVSLLDDESENVRRAAARGLSQIRDAAAVKPILARLAKAAPDHDFARNLVGALGTIGANEALATLQKLEASEEDFWRQLRPFVQNAIVRIKTGNPESLRLDSDDRK